MAISKQLGIRLSWLSWLTRLGQCQWWDEVFKNESIITQMYVQFGFFEWCLALVLGIAPTNGCWVEGVGFRVQGLRVLSIMRVLSIKVFNCKGCDVFN